MHLHDDYRRILDRNDVDAVVIATPDHWHALQCVHACESGKDVYVETPTCATLGEGTAMVLAVQRYGAVVQTGAQGVYASAVRGARDLVANGGLGGVSRIVCNAPANPVGGDVGQALLAPPPQLDWELWLGPARRRPYHPDYAHETWRWMLDIGGGRLRHEGVRMFAVVLACLGRNTLGRVRVTADGTPPGSGLWDCPTALRVTYTLGGPALTIEWSQAKDAVSTAVLHGAQSMLHLNRCDALTATPGTAAPPGPQPIEHWLHCIRAREIPVMDIGAGFRATTLALLGNLAYRLQRPVEWDEATGRIVGDDQANRLLGPPARGPWHL